jgi:hypothetical protein
MFSDDDRRWLAYGKYTRWAENITKPQLMTLLWMIGEYGYRSSRLMAWFDQHEASISSDSAAYARLRMALESIADIVRGKEVNLDDAIQRARETLARLERPSE